MADFAARLPVFRARLEKNLGRLQRWRGREQVACFRVYDRDMPEIPVAIDHYGGDDASAVVAIGWAPRHGGGQAFEAFVEACARVAADVLGATGPAVAQVRESGVGGALDADDVDASSHALVVREGEARFHLRLGARRDPGLFLDHRQTRALVARDAVGKDLLNLFAYTGSFSVQAALAGARSTTSVDLSPSTCRWAEENLALNALSPQTNSVVVADVFAWLETAASGARRYDVVVVDPPSFSRSRRAEGVFDVQRDHPRLLRLALRCLRPGGTLYFSCNRGGFELDRRRLDDDIEVEDLTVSTTPPDFRGTPHACFRLQAHPGRDRQDRVAR